MKTSSPLRLSHLLLAALLGAAPAVRAQSSNDYVRIDVRVQTEQDRKGGGKPGAATTVSQGKTLEIGISGKPKSPETRTGKWTIYGRELKGHDITVLESGEFKIDLPAVGQQKIESAKASASSTTAAAAKPPTGKGKAPVAKKTEPEGTKYIGYSVVVKDGEKVVGEAYDPPGMKTSANK